MSWPGAPDRYDELRRAWIARHAGIFTIQKRRAELLGREIRDRARRTAGARPSPYDDNVIRPLTARRANTVEGAIELVLVAALSVLAPAGWLLGRLLYQWIATHVPDRLRAYPIPALLWTSVGIGILTAAMHDPGLDLRSALVAPWVIAQIPATFLTAGVYAILNGWLAVDGSTDWWPITPPPAPADLDIPLGADDLTGPGVFTQLELAVGERTPARGEPGGRRRSAGAPIAAALILSVIGIGWTVATTVIAVTEAVGAALPSDAAL